MNPTTTQDTNTAVVIPEEIRSFLDGILQDAGMTNLESDMHEEMLAQLFARLDTYLTSAIVDNMPPEHVDEFIRMNEEQKSQAEIQQFLVDKMPNAQEVFANTFADFRTLYLNNVTVAREAPSPDGQSETQQVAS